MSVGVEWMVDAEGCSPASLSDLQTMRDVCAQIIADLDLNVVGSPMWHQFSGAGGVTGLYLLTESHLACHTYPESGTATFNLYCCRARSGWNWEDNLSSMIGAARVSVSRIARGPDSTGLDSAGHYAYEEVSS